MVIKTEPRLQEVKRTFSVLPPSRKAGEEDGVAVVNRPPLLPHYPCRRPWQKGTVPRVRRCRLVTDRPLHHASLIHSP